MRANSASKFVGNTTMQDRFEVTHSDEQGYDW